MPTHCDKQFRLMFALMSHMHYSRGVYLFQLRRLSRQETECSGQVMSMGRLNALANYACKFILMPLLELYLPQAIVVLIAQSRGKSDTLYLSHNSLTTSFFLNRILNFPLISQPFSAPCSTRVPVCTYLGYLIPFKFKLFIIAT